MRYAVITSNVIVVQCAHLCKSASMKWSDLFFSDQDKKSLSGSLTIYQIQRLFFLYICVFLLKVLSAGYVQIRPSFLIPMLVVIPRHSETFALTRKQSSDLEKLAFMSLDCVPASSEGRVLVRRGFYFACCDTSFEKLDAPGMLWGHQR